MSSNPTPVNPRPGAPGRPPALRSIRDLARSASDSVPCSLCDAPAQPGNPSHLCGRCRAGFRAFFGRDAPTWASRWGWLEGHGAGRGEVGAEGDWNGSWDDSIKALEEDR